MTENTEKEKAKKYNTQNLDPVKDTETAKKRGANGGYKSGITKRRRKDMRELMKVLLESEYSKTVATDIVGDLSLLGGDLSVANVLNLKMIQEASEGNSKAYEIIRDTAGFKPVEQVQVDANVITEQDRMLLEKLAKREGIKTE